MWEKSLGCYRAKPKDNRLMDLGLGTPELGMVRLSELEAFEGPFGLGIERDLWFLPAHPISVYADAARQAGRIVEFGPELDEGARDSEPMREKPVPDTVIFAAPADTPPPMHPMDPRRGENLTPMFGAFLCWLIDLEPMTDPAIAGISIAGDSMLAATTESPFFDAHLGSVDEFERNLRGWGEACGADPDVVDALVARLRRARQ